jgi:hypothetical protein
MLFAFVYLYMNTKSLVSFDESIFILILAACELAAELFMAYNKLG